MMDMNERNSRTHLSCKLQLCVSDNWLDVLYFEPEEREYVRATMASLSALASYSVLWRVVRVRTSPSDWLTRPAQWQSITDQEPAPLEDVLVSVSIKNDEPPTVFMAYRKAAGEKTFYVSGTSDHVILGTYAWKSIDEPAPAPNDMA